MAKLWIVIKHQKKNPQMQSNELWNLLTRNKSVKSISLSSLLAINFTPYTFQGSRLLYAMGIMHYVCDSIVYYLIYWYMFHYEIANLRNVQCSYTTNGHYNFQILFFFCFCGTATKMCRFLYTFLLFSCLLLYFLYFFWRKNAKYTIHIPKLNTFSFLSAMICSPLIQMVCEFTQFLLYVDVCSVIKNTKSIFPGKNSSLNYNVKLQTFRFRQLFRAKENCMAFFFGISQTNKNISTFERINKILLSFTQKIHSIFYLSLNMHIPNATPPSFKIRS